MSPLIFTTALRDKAKGELDALRPQLLRWAGAEGDQGERVRDQIERAAALVPEAKRSRVLGPISERVGDDQVKAAVGGLLLAKMLSDQGWSIEFEPIIGTQTPDLFIRKAAVEYVVEVRRVVGRADEGNRPRLLVQRALKGIRTATPLHINALEVEGSASLKPLVEHVRTVLATRPKGPQQFKSRGVFVAYEIADPGGDAPIFPAVFGWPSRVILGNDADRVEAAINEKLRAYKQPIVVALDLDGVVYAFDDVVEAFYGEQKIIVPVHMGGDKPPGEARLGPLQDGMLVGRDRNASRARERLIALLPFSWGLTLGGSSGAVGFDELARVMANPASEPPSTFDEFAPIPRFIAGERVDEQTVMMRWEPRADPSGWRHLP